MGSDKSKANITQVRDRKSVQEKVQIEIKEAIDRLGVLTVVMSSCKDGDVRFLCKLNTETDTQTNNNNNWLKVLQVLLSEEDKKGGRYYSFYGQKYYLNNEGGFNRSWVIILDGEDLEDVSTAFRRNLAVASAALPGGGTTKEASKWAEDMVITVPIYTDPVLKGDTRVMHGTSEQDLGATEIARFGAPPLAPGVGVSMGRI